MFSLAGFRAVECLFPYDWPAEALAGRLRDAGLELVLFNAPPGDWEAGELQDEVGSLQRWDAEQEQLSPIQGFAVEGRTW